MEELIKAIVQAKDEGVYELQVATGLVYTVKIKSVVGGMVTVKDPHYDGANPIYIGVHHIMTLRKV